MVKYTFEVRDQKAQPVLSIRKKTTVEKLPDLIGESYTKIMDYMNELGEQPAGVPFTAYYSLDMHDLDVEMGFPVTRPLPEKDEIKAGETPAGKIVSTMYKGPYAGMEEPYTEMAKWINDNGYKSTGVYYEYYYNSPADVPESDLLTKIVMPVKES
ncbi:MAG TPA: GyrI-like domain-containing protein [Atribacteraceae bacterium]|nr:GyrI-like domain-containing protein [Atribacteraceae bacterium]